MSRTFAVSDLHGCLDLYNQICNFIEPDDVVYFLGDAGDRGPNPWETIKAIRANPQWIYIKGNHEQLLENFLYTYYHCGCSDDYDAWRLECNGGAQTIEEFMMDEKTNDELAPDWIKFFAELPRSATYIAEDGAKIFMSHSGYIDWHPDIKRDTKDKDLIWSRDHFRNTWDNYQYIYDYVIHGHTPIPYVQEEVEHTIVDKWEYGAYWYAPDAVGNMRKCCIDNGCFTTNVCCLLDLNTFDEHIFMGGNENG